jgi:hypothetical protein
VIFPYVLIIYFDQNHSLHHPSSSPKTNFIVLFLYKHKKYIDYICPPSPSLLTLSPPAGMHPQHRTCFIFLSSFFVVRLGFEHRASHSESYLQHILLWLFWRWSFPNCLPVVASNCDPANPASQVASITGMSHWHLTVLHLLSVH